METEKSKLESVLLDDVMIGLGSIEVVATTEKSSEVSSTKSVDSLIVEGLVDPSSSPNANGNVVKSMISIDDLLSDSSESFSTPPIVLPTFTSMSTAPSTVLSSKFEEAKSSRVRGLDELDFLGENALRAHLPQKSPQVYEKI